VIALTWAYGSSNFGDQAVTRGALALLGRVTPGDVWAYSIQERRSVPAAATVVYGGGEHLFSHRRLRRYARPIARATRGVVLPSTFGPFLDTDHDLLRRVGRHPIAAREATSAVIAGSILGREVPVLLDPAFFFPSAPGVRGDTTIYAPRREDIGLRLGTQQEPGPAAETEAFDRYRSLIRGGLIVAHSERDEALCRALSEATGVPWVRPATLDDLIELYRTCAAVVTSRFHAAVFGLLFGKPVTAIPWPAHGHKLTGLMDSPPDVERDRIRTEEWLRSALA
jgi:hypothetical protein